MAYLYTTQAALRAAFWADHPNLQRRRIRNYSGNGLMHVTDTRVAWVDWLDHVNRAGMASNALVNRATLSKGD